MKSGIRPYLKRGTADPRHQSNVHWISASP
jgi:hypothetical protein